MLPIEGKPLRTLKGSGSYLKSQTRGNLAKASMCIVVAAFVGVVLALRLLMFGVNLFELVFLLAMLVPLGGFYFYLRQYHIYSGGLKGEQQVAKTLKENLNDDYYLLNDAHFHDDYGDVDHILLGPNGIFVIETKNWSGKITCHGDEWQRQNGRHNTGSPSIQAKKNAAAVKRAFDGGSFRPPVQAVVVFTNNHADLHVSNPGVPVVRLPQLVGFVRSVNGVRGYSREQVELMGKQLIKQMQ
jgi:hypothetical protein